MNKKVEEKKQSCSNCQHYEKLGGFNGNCELEHGITCQGLGKICFVDDVCEDYIFGEPKCYYF